MEILAFDRKFDRSSFSSGKPDLDDWLRRQAGHRSEPITRGHSWPSKDSRSSATTPRRRTDSASMRLPGCSVSAGGHIQFRLFC